MRRKYLLRTLLFGLTWLAASCGGSGPPDPPPFDAVLIDLFGTTDTDAYIAEQLDYANELVAECMIEAGFEFTAPAASAVSPASNQLSREFAEQEGFGIISTYLRAIAEISIDAPPVDPNLAYVSTLSNAEVARYFLTLDGVEAEPGQRSENTGCNGQASETAYREWNRFSESLPNFTALGEERDTHPDWIATRLLWQECMQERDFDYAEPDAVRGYVRTRLQDAVAEVYPDGQVPLVYVDGQFAIDPSVDELLADLTAFERNAAIANFDCAEPLAERFAEVEWEVQQSFVERNQAIIDELLAASGR